MIERIKQIMEHEGLTASAFAERTDISRATLTHLLNGRNNPSLDVVMRILDTFKNINTDWMINGRPPMYKNEKSFPEPDLFAGNRADVPESTVELEYVEEMEVKPPLKQPKESMPQDFMAQFRSSKNIDKIVVFFKDNTYITLKPED